MSAATMRRRQFRGSDAKRKAAGWGIVIAVHALIIWALLSGTARKSLDVLKKPLQASVIQEVTIPPPPPPPPKRVEPPRRIKKALAPPPKRVEPPRPIRKAVAPPPPFVPPPEVAPPPSPAAVSVPSVPAPPAAPPAAAVGPAAAGGSTGTARGEVGVACPVQVQPEPPRWAVRQGIQGTVRAEALIHDGKITRVTILSGPAAYHQAVRDAMMQYKCVSGPGDVLVTQQFVFRVTE